MSSSKRFFPEDILVRVWQISHDLPEEGQLALFDESQSQLVVLNPLGGAFWKRLDSRTTLIEIATEISEEVPGAPGPDAVLNSSHEFLADLLIRGAVDKI